MATATATGGEKGAAESDYNEAKEEERAGLLEMSAALPAVSVVSKEQAMQLLKPGPHERAATRKRTRAKSKSKDATEAGKSEAEAEAGTEDSSLEGKFVDLVDLLLPVPIKGEFDVNKIKSSLYFFS